MLSPRNLKQRRLSAIALFVFLQSCLLAGLGFRFTEFLGPEPFSTAFYLRASWILYIFAAGLLTATLLRVFTPFPRVGLFVAALLATPVALYFYYDFFVYEAFRVHAGFLMHHLAEAGSTHPAIAPFAFESLKRVVPTILVLQLLLAWAALRLSYAGLALPLPGWKAFLVAGLLFTADRTYAAHAAFHGKHWFTGQTEAFPLYANVTANSRFALFEERPPFTRHRRTRDLPEYQLTTYDDRPATKLAGPMPNILWILVESWRRDAITTVHMPKLHAQLPQFTVAGRHVSGGNATRPGVYALFYSLNHNIADRLLAEKRGPYFFRRLLADGYDIHINSGEPLDFLGTRESVFIDVDGWIADHFYYRPAVSDWMAFKEAREVLRTTPVGRPFFNFLFLSATHSKYHSLPGMEPFQPVATKLSVPGYLDSHRPETKNRYYNSLHFADELITRLLAEARQRADWDNTLVIITGDHGEEFWEHGHFEHSSAFNEEQTAVPLLVRFPGTDTGTTLTHLTTHYDVVPTVLKVMGDTRPLDTYSVGRPLHDQTPRRVLQSNWNVYSLFDGNTRITYPAGALNFLRPVAVSDDHGQILPIADYVAANRLHIEEALREHRRFYPETAK